MKSKITLLAAFCSVSAHFVTYQEIKQSIYGVEELRSGTKVFVENILNKPLSESLKEIHEDSQNQLLTIFWELACFANLYNLFIYSINNAGIFGFLCFGYCLVGQYFFDQNKKDDFRYIVEYAIFVSMVLLTKRANQYAIHGLQHWTMLKIVLFGIINIIPCMVLLAVAFCLKIVPFTSVFATSPTEQELIDRNEDFKKYIISAWIINKVGELGIIATEGLPVQLGLHRGNIDGFVNDLYVGTDANGRLHIDGHRKVDEEGDEHSLPTNLKEQLKQMLVDGAAELRALYTPAVEEEITAEMLGGS